MLQGETGGGGLPLRGSQVAIGGHTIGRCCPTFVIAEAGVNHDGDVEQAHRLIDVAATSGATAVKFQTFEPERITSSRAAAAPYQQAQGAHGQYEMLRRLTLPTSAWGELAAHARESGLLFLSTAFDEHSLRIVVDLDVPALKVPSGELTNIALVEDMASIGLPLILSTGMATQAEVSAAIEASAAAPSVVLLHCVTAYPTPVEQSNLRAISSLRETFRVPVGWSDHTQGSLTAVGAVALGACLLEKHITLDRHGAGPDHAASEDPDGFSAYVADVRRIEAALGSGEKRPQRCELDNIVPARRSHHARRDLLPGDTIGDEDTELLRPAVGLSPATGVVGRVVKRRVSAGDAIRAEDLA